jgi:hypothetical protein
VVADQWNENSTEPKYNVNIQCKVMMHWWDAQKSCAKKDRKLWMCVHAMTFIYVTALSAMFLTVVFRSQLL